jgi:hypothetical protein
VATGQSDKNAVIAGLDAPQPDKNGVLDAPTHREVQLRQMHWKVGLHQVHRKQQTFGATGARQVRPVHWAP